MKQLWCCASLSNLIDTSSFAFAPAPRLPSNRSPLSDPAGCLNAAISQSHLHPEALYQAQLFLFDCLFFVVVVVPDLLLKAVKLHFIKAQLDGFYKKKKTRGSFFVKGAESVFVLLKSVVADLGLCANKVFVSEQTRSRLHWCCMQAFGFDATVSPNCHARFEYFAALKSHQDLQTSVS